MLVKVFNVSVEMNVHAVSRLIYVKNISQTVDSLGI
jgi:hypothetical protein